MKHPSNRDLFARWDAARGRNPAPDRASFSPETLGPLLADAFVAAHGPAGGFTFRVAGSRLCARAGRDLKDQAILSIFQDTVQPRLADIMAITADESLPTIAGLTGQSPTGETFSFELLVLPLAHEADSAASLAGALVAFEPVPHALPLLGLVSFRHLHARRLTLPRMIRRFDLLRGLTVYEGLH